MPKAVQAQRGTWPYDCFDHLWNRAALNAGGDRPERGDRALADALALHTLCMNGGLLHALEVLTEAEIHAAMDGCRYLRLPQVVAVITATWNAARDVAEDHDALERLELHADARYSQVVSDTILEACARAAVDLAPGDFAPLDVA